MGPINPPSSELIPGAESDLAEAIARERGEAWAALVRACMETGDNDAVEAVQHMALLVIYASNPVGGMQATITALDWYTCL